MRSMYVWLWVVQYVRVLDKKKEVGSNGDYINDVHVTLEELRYAAREEEPKENFCEEPDVDAKLHQRPHLVVNVVRWWRGDASFDRDYHKWHLDIKGSH